MSDPIADIVDIPKTDPGYIQAFQKALVANGLNDTYASTPGGLLPSVRKVQILELIATGNKWDPNDTRVRDLPGLISHLNWGDTQPAVVVSVDDTWVKVAAYSDEFDTIVLLGFPTKAVDLIAPGGRRPAVGTRLLVVCQFGRRCTCTTTTHVARTGVLGDITMGPKTYDRWFNFHPLVAQFFADDDQAPILNQRLQQVDGSMWQKVWDDWLAWKERHGENYFRLGAMSTAWMIATNH